jgi:hypothetical protein
VSALDYQPIRADQVVDILLAQRGTPFPPARYFLSGGAAFTEPSAFHPGDNLKAGTCDCSGLIAFALRYRRHWQNVNGILADAWDVVRRRPGPMRHYRLIHREEPVRPSDLVLHAGPDLDHDGVPDAGGHGHIGGVTGVLGDGLRHDPDWPHLFEITHCSGRLQEHIDPATGARYGAVRTTDASLWALDCYWVRALHVTA